MKYNVIIPMALVLIIVVGGFVLLQQPDDVSTQMEEEEKAPVEEEQSLPPFGDGEQRGQGAILGQLIPGIQELVNASASPEEILEYVRNTTDQMSSRFNQTGEVPEGGFPEGFPEDRVSPFLEFFEELETEIQGLIDQGASSQDILDHVSEKMQEIMEEMSSRFQPG